MLRNTRGVYRETHFSNEKERSEKRKEKRKRTVRQSPRVILLRVHLGHVSAKHLVEESQEDRKQRVLHQRQPRRQVLRRAKVPQEAGSDGDDLWEK